MTSNDAPDSAPGAFAGRRRALGRGPGTSTSTPRTAPPAEPNQPHTRDEPAESAEPAAPAESAAPAEAAEERRERPAAAPETPGGLLEPRPGHEADERAAPGNAAADRRPTAVPPTAATRARPLADDGPEADGQPSPEAVPEVPEVPEAAGGDVPPGEDDGGVFKVRLSNFEGPFDLLLQLISKHKLDVTEVALSKVTDEFMAHIRAMGPDWDLDETTEFLVVAATLLDLKAARLLPAAEVEDEGDLALLEARDLLFARLLQYRAYKQIADIFNRRLEEEARRYPRTVGLEPHHAELLPEVVISIGAEGFARLAVKAMQPRPKPQVYVDHIHAPLVSVQEQAGVVVARLRELGEASFRTLVEDTDDTLTVVARFLALLELYREKAVALEQETALGDLIVRWTGGEGDGTPRVTDEFDRPPAEPEESRQAKAPKEEEKA
ncbi:segregation/condensation protein A [Streptomyces sp. NPDC020801]|uniref:segregation and condensation protein A n=1 Tax=unclassified Streptomyces TaxID=2593676 RepID=UPI0037B516C9